MGVANWTRGFMEKFKELRGYDMSGYMPVLTNKIVGNRDISNRFLHDFRRTVSDLIADEFYRTFTDIAHENGIYTHPESGGPHSAPIDAIKTMGYNDVPMGEFWVRSNTHRVSDAQRLCVKQSASVAHLYGKQFVAAEGPTSIGPQWERPPKDCKNVIDRIFCSGINRIVWHTFTASDDKYGEPGNEYFAFNVHRNTVVNDIRVLRQRHRKLVTDADVDTEIGDAVAKFDSLFQLAIQEYGTATLAGQKAHFLGQAVSTLRAKMGFLVEVGVLPKAAQEITGKLLIEGVDVNKASLEELMSLRNRLAQRIGLS
jgi:hypothetical protein